MDVAKILERLFLEPSLLLALAAHREDRTRMSMSRPPPRAVLGSNTSTNTHLAILGALLCFSFDQLNPVKRVSLLLFDDDDASYIFGWFLVLLLAWAVQRDFANVCFYAARIFLNAIMSIVISNVEVIGAEHIPLAGPVILVANHSNQARSPQRAAAPATTPPCRPLTGAAAPPPRRRTPK